MVLVLSEIDLKCRSAYCPVEWLLFELYLFLVFLVVQRIVK